MEPKEEGTSTALFPPLFPTTLPLLPSSLALPTLYPTATRHQAVIPFSPFARQSVSFTVFSCGRVSVKHQQHEQEKRERERESDQQRRAYDIRRVSAPFLCEVQGWSTRNFTGSSLALLIGENSDG